MAISSGRELGNSIAQGVLVVTRPTQLTVDKVTQAASAQTKQDQRGNKIRNLEEVALGAAGKPQHHRDHANRAAVE